MIGDVFAMLFGGGRNILRETAEVFRPNAEASEVRHAARQAAALAQFASEFDQPRRSWFDRMIDGLNRLPRPLLAFGTIGLFVTAMVEPVWFAQRMQGVALVPEPLWWLMGAVVSFYFGARHQAKAQDFQRAVAATFAQTPQAVANIERLERASHSRAEAPVIPPSDEAAFVDNAALEDWRLSRER